MKSKKLFLLFFGIFIFMIIPKNVNAQVSYVRLYDANYTLISGVSGTCNYHSPDYPFQNVRYIRFILDDSLQSSKSYNATFNVSITALDDYAWVYWNGASGFNIGGGYRASSPTSARTTSQSAVIGPPNVYSKSSSWLFTFTTGTSLSNPFYQLDLGSARSIVGACMDNYNIELNQSQNADSQAIINNNNMNTSSIIANDNRNTEQIIGVQQETTEAIEDLNDNITDSNVSVGANVLDNAIQETDLGFGALFLNIIDFIEDIFDSSCSSLTLPLPFVNTNVVLPCMSSIYTTHFPTFFQLYQLITTGLIAYRVIINLIAKVHQLEDPNYDKVEVLNL